MNKVVSLEVIIPDERFLALVALERLLTSMSELMSRQLRGSLERLLAVIMRANVRLVVLMHSLVNSKRNIELEH